MVISESKMLKLEEIGQELAKKKKKQELEKNRLNVTITWTGGSVVACFMMPFVREDYWGLVSICAICAFIGLPLLFWTGSRVSKVNQEVENLERKRKELRNLLR